MIVPAYKTLFVVNPIFFSQLTCCLASIIGIGCCQPDADSAFIDLEAQAAMIDESGIHFPVSHLEIALSVIFNFSANCACVRPFSFLQTAINFPVSI